MKVYQERYDGILGAGRWAKDKLLGVPREVTAFFGEGRRLYLEKMDAVLDDISNYIAEQLTAAKEKISEGKQKIKDFVENLEPSLKTVGEEAARDIQGQFEELEDKVNNAGTALVDKLAKQYTDKVQQLDGQIEEMKKSNQPWFAKAVEAIASAIETINNLRKMLQKALARIAEVVGIIIKNPIGFLGNLIQGLSQGFQNFVSNIFTHLQTGLIAWLTGTLGPTGIQIPENLFSLAGIFNLVMQVLGLTWDYIRSKAVKMFGETVVAAMEKGAEIFQVLRTGGVMGLWEYVKEQFSDLKEMVIEQIKSMVTKEVIKAGVKWILGLLSPVGAFIKAATAIYDIIMFFVERAAQIGEFVNSVLDAVGAIASGAIGGAAKLVENALAKSLPVLIGLLASLAGVTGVVKKVQGIIKRIRRRIDKAIDKLLLKVKNLFKRKKNRDKKSKEKQATNLPEVKFKDATGENHRMWLNKIGKKYQLMVASGGKRKVEDSVKKGGEFENIEGQQENEVISKSRKIEQQAVNVVENNQPSSIKTIESKMKEVSDTLASGQGFVYKINDQLKGKVAQDTIAEQSNNITDLTTDKEIICYVANIPTVPKDKSPKQIAQQYRNEGFTQPDEAKSRFGLVVGINSYDSITKEQKENESTVKEKVKTDGWQGSRLGVFGFLWQANWINTNNGKKVANLKEVRDAFKKLPSEQQEAAKEKDQEFKKAIPYDLIRNKIKNHGFTKRFVSELGKNGNEVYIHTGDPDAVSLKAASGKQSGDLPIQELGNALFERYDKIIKEKIQESETNTPPAIISGGYEFRMEGAGGKTSDALRGASNKLDMAVRQAMGRINPFTVYFPEPNTIIRVKPGTDTIEASFTSVKGTSEGQAIVKDLRNKRQLQSKDVVFDMRAAIETSSERFTTTIKGQKVDILTNWTGGKLEGLTEDHIKALFNSSQTHAHKIYWIRRMISQYPGGKTTISGRGKAIKDVYNKYFPNELIGFAPNKLKEALNMYPAVENYGNISVQSHNNLASTGDLDSVIKIAKASGDAVAKFLKEILGIN